MARLIAAEDLVRAGWLVTVTTDNAPNVDLLAARPDASRAIAVQVKGSEAPLGDRMRWLIGSSSGERRFPVSSIFYWALVHAPTRQVFWVPSSKIKIARRTYTNRRTGRPVNWFVAAYRDVEGYLDRVPRH